MRYRAILLALVHAAVLLALLCCRPALDRPAGLALSVALLVLMLGLSERLLGWVERP